MASDIDLIRSCEDLFLHSLHEAGDQDLRLVLHEARAGEPPNQAFLDAEPPELRPLLARARPIAHDADCRVFELTWEGYVAYAVRNESYAVQEPASSQGTGRRVVEYSASRYLDYVREATLARDDHPGPVTHWCIHCAFHVVDVVSTRAPTVVVR